MISGYNQKVLTRTCLVWKEKKCSPKAKEENQVKTNKTSTKGSKIKYVLYCMSQKKWARKNTNKDSALNKVTYLISTLLTNH